MSTAEIRTEQPDLEAEDVARSCVGSSVRRSFSHTDDGAYGKWSDRPHLDAVVSVVPGCGEGDDTDQKRLIGVVIAVAIAGVGTVISIQGWTVWRQGQAVERVADDYASPIEVTASIEESTRAAHSCDYRVTYTVDGTSHDGTTSTPRTPHQACSSVGNRRIVIVDAAEPTSVTMKQPSRPTSLLIAGALVVVWVVVAAVRRWRSSLS